ncbi:MAG: hypothetical protein SGPRY_014254 [Prymnesium sp.]
MELQQELNQAEAAMASALEEETTLSQSSANPGVEDNQAVGDSAFQARKEHEEATAQRDEQQQLRGLLCSSCVPCECLVGSKLFEATKESTTPDSVGAAAGPRLEAAKKERARLSHDVRSHQARFESWRWPVDRLRAAEATLKDLSAASLKSANLTKLLQEERRLHEAEAELHARAKLLGKSAGAMRHRVESGGVQPGVCESCGQPVSAEHLTTHLGRLESDERRAQATPLCFTSMDDRGYV